MSTLNFGALCRWLFGLFARRPAEAIGVVFMSIAAMAILVNAVFLQPRPHPAPFFSPKTRAASSADAASAGRPALPRPRPGEREARPVEESHLPRARTQTVADIQRELSRRGFYDGPTDGVYGVRTDAAIRDFLHLAGLKPEADTPEAIYRAIMKSPLKATASAKPAPGQNVSVQRQNDPIAGLLAPSKKVLAVQRALADFGYGQVAPTGQFDPSTKTAIERFERERKLPVTGQISDRLVRELAATTGRPLE
jgi:peptidoglycan hydrolase-like protein with peptidoglycan-binding domain